MWGAVVGDALGVPVEFRSRAERQHDPVTGMRGHGTHDQPAGTWSDDSSLLLCTVDSLLTGEFKPEDMGQRFVAWSQGQIWTPWGSVFDIGGATRRALGRIERGVPAEEAGGTGEDSNGNGSLMRILPIALRFWAEPAERLLELAFRASSITHRHPRSQMACGFYCLVVAGLLRGQTAPAAHQSAVRIIGPRLETSPLVAAKGHFLAALSQSLAGFAEADIPSGGHVVDTLTASLWCLLTSSDFAQTVLKVVNLGGDPEPFEYECRAADPCDPPNYGIGRKTAKSKLLAVRIWSRQIRHAPANGLGFWR